MTAQPPITNLFSGVYEGKKVLLTGHTGFKGSWLIYWLNKLGAEVCGYALAPPTDPNHFELLDLNIISKIADIRDLINLKSAVEQFEPDIVFHLAAQPLVRLSYEKPIETFETNIIGTANVFEACRNSSSVKAIINITSDKCYQNNESRQGYRENDRMGGYDPYSASKGCSELITSSYRNSFYNLDDYGLKHNILLTSCRAGNVIGGGDWAVDRLIPDIMKAVNEKRVVDIRNPSALRPWQHVLEPLSGYLQIGQKLLEGKKEFAEAWNFGPCSSDLFTVGDVVKSVKKYWPKVNYHLHKIKDVLHEAELLMLDSTKAYNNLKWHGVWSGEETFKRTVNWYKNYYENGIINTEEDLNSYISDAIDKKLYWAE